MSRRLGLAGLVAASACWGSTVVLIKLAARSLSPIAITFVEMTAALVGLLIVLALNRSRLGRPSRGAVVAGLLEPGLGYILINAGLARTSGTHGALLIGTESLFIVALASVIGRTRPSWLTLLGLGSALGGAVFVAHGGSGRASVAGDVLVVLGAVAAAGYVVLAHRLSSSVDPLPFTCQQFGVGWLFTAFIVGIGTLLGAHQPIHHATAAGIELAAAAGVVGSALAFLLYNGALRRVTAAQAGISLTLIPVFGVVFSTLFLHEAISGETFAAGGAVVVGLVLTQVGESRLGARALAHAPIGCSSVDLYDEVPVRHDVPPDGCPAHQPLADRLDGP